MQLHVHTWTKTLLIIQKTVKKQLYFDDFQTTSPTPGFLARDVTITIFLIEFELVELQISLGIQKSVVLWVSEQYIKNY